MSISKLTVKHQTTIPKEVRKSLGLKAGDLIEFEVMDKNDVRIKKVNALDLAYLKPLSSTLNEWNSDFDAEDYRDLQIR